jgi:glycosyltransferase involved in cell wall biosynthesis
MIRCISIVPYRFLPPKAGGHKLLALFYKYLSRHLSVACIGTVNNQPAAAEGYEVLRMLATSPFRYINPFYILSIRRIIRERKITHLILEHPYYGWLGVCLKWLCGVKLVAHSHNIEGLRWKTLGKWWWRILWIYEKWLHRHADYNFFIQDEDKKYAIENWSLDPRRCLTVTYGIEWDRLPDPLAVAESRKRIREQYGISEDSIVLCFNGAFNYRPNLDALHTILESINPLLLTKSGFRYNILICGIDIPEAVNSRAYPHVIFAGFVPDITPYWLASDIFLNPVVDGGGIKTKLVEALGNNLNTVSVRNGAIGVDPAWCNGKLLICENGDWDAFARLVVDASRIRAEIPPVYFEHFYWESIVRKAVAFIA